MKAILIRFEPEMLARLRALAESNGMSVANLIRFIVSEWLKSKG
jgi:predicted DNA-binding protein